MRAVQITAFGGTEVLKIVDIPKPEPKPGEVVVRVVAAGTNPGEISIRTGALKDLYPKPFPFGQGTDFSGYVDAAGEGVSEFASGDAVVGWSDQRASQAEFVVVPAKQLIAKPLSLDFYRGGALYVAGMTGLASVRAVAAKAGEVVAISGAAGGVGSFATQLAVRTGARVIAIASAENEAFLRSLGAEFVAYGDGLADRLRATAPKLDAFIDLFGSGYLDLAIELGVAKERINTIIDFPGAQKYGTKSEGGGAVGSAGNMTMLADLIAWGEIKMPIHAIYPFDMQADAYEELAKRKTRGKIVFAIDPKIEAPIRPPKSPITNT